MSGRGKDREWIDRNVSVPVVAYNWAATPGAIILGKDHGGMIEEWRGVRDRIRRRRSKQAVGSKLYRACEDGIALVDYITKAGQAGAIQGNWRPSFEILRDVALIYESVTGEINPLVQAVVRDAMDETFTEERFGK